MKPTTKCPKCGRKAKPDGVTGELAYCSWCAATFDAADPDEGGDYSDRDPSARIEREERHQTQRQSRFTRR